MKNRNLHAILILITALLVLLPACSRRAYIQRNDLLVADGRFQEALADYQQRLAEDPNDSELHYQVAKTLFLQGKTKEAIPAIEKAIILDRLIDRYQLLAGKIKYTANSNFEAIDHLTNALILNPQLLEAHYYLALAHERAGQAEAALAQLQTALSIEPLYFEAQLAWAEIRFHQLVQSETGIPAMKTDAETEAQATETAAAQPDSPMRSYLELIDALEKALRIRPDSVPAHLLLSEIYRTLGADYKSRSLLEQWLADFGSDDRILLALAEIAYRNGRWKSSLQRLDRQSNPNLESRILKLKIMVRSRTTLETRGEIEELLREHPDSEALRLLSGQWHLKMGNIIEAEREVQRCLELNPYFAEAYFTLSRIHAAQNDISGAQWALRKALQLAPANLEIRLAYLRSLVEQGNWYEAEAQLKQYALDEDHPDVIFLRGLIAVERGNDPLAEKLFLEAARTQYSVRTETRLAEIEIRRGQYRSAEIRLKRIGDFHPQNLDIALTRAQLLLQLNRDEEVGPLLMPYLDHKEGRGRVHRLLAESQIQAGQTAAALKILRTAVDRWPRSPELVQAYTLLLGIEGRYRDAIPLLEEMMTFDHPYSRLFYFRLREFYFRAGETEKFRSFQRQYQLDHSRVRRLN